MTADAGSKSLLRDREEQQRDQGDAERAERQDAQLDMVARPDAGQHAADADAGDQRQEQRAFGRFGAAPPPSAASWSMLSWASAPTA